GSWTAEDEANIGELLAAAFPDRIARRQEAEGRGPPGSGEGIFRFPGGREARIRGALARENWLCALDVDAGERQGFIRLAAPLSEARALEILEKQALEDIKIEWKGLVPRTFETRRAGRLVLSEKRRPSLRKELLPALGPLLREKGLALLPWEGEGSGPRRLLERIRFFAAHGTTAPSPAGANAGGPGQQAGQDWTEEALIRDAADWLGPFLRDGAENGKGPVLEGGGLLRALENRLGWKNRQELDRLVPEMFILPAGKKKRIDYSSGEPVLRLRLQDAFGISSVCKILSVSIIFHLLSPADRPVQITRDPAGFWSGSYAEVRKEMKGRYPKHYWPENPMSGADRGQ
ncbi:MAG: ATP-dependent helicase, partial [Treponema sp.]|nr:ATP-dependent helicase [Treponema sp.]